MTLDLTALAAKAKPAEMTTARRGRTATPIPDAILKLVQDSYELPEGQGTTLPVPVGEKNDDGSDKNAKATVGTLRRAADALNLGLSVSIGEPNGKTVPVTFRATDRRIVNRAQKPVDIYVTETEDGITVADEGDEDARLATVPEAKLLGYVWDSETAAWTDPTAE